MLALEYSMGTLLISGGSELQQSQLPSTFKWDLRIGQFRAMGIHYRSIVEHFAEHNISFEDKVAASKLNQVGSWATIPLYPYQQLACSSWVAEGQKGIVVLPTGAGKTRVAIESIRTADSSTLIQGAFVCADCLLSIV